MSAAWHDKPTKSGYYWRWSKGKKVNKHSLFVLLRHEGELMVTDGGDILWHLWEYKNAKWFGPLEPPEPPAQIAPSGGQG